MSAVSTAEFRGRAFHNEDAGARFFRAERGAQSRVTASQNQNIDCHAYRFGRHIYRFRGGLRKFRIRLMTSRSRSLRAMR
jgi:hypothetical protein